MAKNNFTEAELKALGYVETKPGQWFRPIKEFDEAKKVIAEGGTIEESGSFIGRLEKPLLEYNATMGKIQRDAAKAKKTPIITGSLDDCVASPELKEMNVNIKITTPNGKTFFNNTPATQCATDSFWEFIISNCSVYIFDIVPNTKPRQTVSDKWKKRKCVMQYRAFADTIRSQATMLRFKLTSPLIVEFHVPMPKSWGTKKRREMDGKLHTQVPDCDNFCKAIQDSLLGQDNLISEIHARKIWSTTGRIIIYA